MEASNPIQVAAYTAGLIDGEGCIRMQKNYGLALSIGNTSLEMLEWMRDRWGGKVYVNRHNYPNSKPFFHWKIHGKDAVSVIAAVLPFMVVKREQALKAVELGPLIGVKNNYVLGFNDEMRGKRQAIYEDLKTLNRRGLQ